MYYSYILIGSKMCFFCKKTYVCLDHHKLRNMVARGPFLLPSVGSVAFLFSGCPPLVAFATSQLVHSIQQGNTVAACTSWSVILLLSLGFFCVLPRYYHWSIQDDNAIISSIVDQQRRFRNLWFLWVLCCFWYIVLIFPIVHFYVLESSPLYPMVFIILHIHALSIYIFHCLQCKILFALNLTNVV